MARMILILIGAALLVSACGAPQKNASRLYAKGVKYYYFDSHDEAQGFFQSAADTGYILPGTYASLGVTLIKQGHVEEGVTLLDKEYALYHDPLVKDYIAFIRERFELNGTPAAPAEPAPSPESVAPLTPPEQIAPAAGGDQ